jgi:hypothetical protein
MSRRSSVASFSSAGSHTGSTSAIHDTARLKKIKHRRSADDPRSRALERIRHSSSPIPSVGTHKSLHNDDGEDAKSPTPHGPLDSRRFKCTVCSEESKSHPTLEELMLASLVSSKLSGVAAYGQQCKCNDNEPLRSSYC